MNILNLAYSSDIFGSFVFVAGWQHGLLLALGRRLGCLGQEFFSCLQLSAVDAGSADGSGLDTWIWLETTRNVRKSLGKTSGNHWKTMEHPNMLW